MANQSQIQQCIQGLQRLLSDSDFAADCLNSQDLCQLLSDGDVLCTVLTQLSNGRISNDDGTYSAINSQFMAKSNLKFFVEQCQEEFGMCEDELFEPDDLLTMSNPEKVVSSIHKLVSKSGQVVPKPRRQSNISVEFGMREDELFEPDDLLTMSNPEKVVSSIHKLVSKSGQVVPKPKRQSNISVGGGMMDKIIKEICDHEKALVDKLTKLLLYRQELLGLLSEWSEEFVEVVFRHTEQLYLVHKEFHEKLSALADQGCEQFCMQLPDLYNELAPKLEVYKNYFSDLPTAEEIMKDGFKKTPSLQIQLKLLERHFNNGCTGLGFRALFEAPIRQTTSYLMLFERLQKAAEKDIPDAAPCVGEIVAAMQDFLDKTNEYKKQAEQLAATKEILRQIQQLPTDLGNPTLIGLHLGNDSFKVKTVKSGKVESIICACILTTKQLIVANKPPRKDGQSTYAFNIPVDTIMEVRKCEKTFALELIQNDGDRVTLECLKRSKDLLSLWKKL
ncbi:hypothetical protein BOX15_Mlig005259g1 [Macrostomum lignano]|uniref:DH domain-containing protein n=1 Tax=Macrostomum lignano TaxID=282301 RepID=A0A267DJ11_9PLAT|nr:hypothetical protein BOX15_Mlig005259g1 [Macrostomum lignano]